MPTYCTYIELLTGRHLPNYRPPTPKLMIMSCIIMIASTPQQREMKEEEAEREREIRGKGTVRCLSSKRIKIL